MLIDEIEKTASLDHGNAARISAYLLVESYWWPRIRAALVAAMEMDDRFDAHDLSGLNDACIKFREAMGE